MLKDFKWLYGRLIADDDFSIFVKNGKRGSAICAMDRASIH